MTTQARYKALDEIVVKHITPLMEVFVRVHSELSDGKPWKEIDNGLRQDNGQWSYDHWHAYMTQRIVGAARSLVIVDQKWPIETKS